jgi:hypothetical protein
VKTLLRTSQAKNNTLPRRVNSNPHSRPLTSQFVDKINLVADRKQGLQTAKLKKKAKADRTILQRRKTAQIAKSEVDRALLQREMVQANMLDQLKTNKNVVRRTSVSFTPSKVAPDGDRKAKRAEKKKHSELFKQSMDSMLEVKESRKGMKTVLATSQIPIGGEELFENSEEGSPSLGSPSFAMDSKFSVGSMSAGGRPKSRGELLPPSMFSAERIYDKGRCSPPQVPFGTTGPRTADTPASVLRQIRSPDARTETAGKLISSPTPWS